MAFRIDDKVYSTEHNWTGVVAELCKDDVYLVAFEVDGGSKRRLCYGANLRPAVNEGWNIGDRVWSTSHGKHGQVKAYYPGGTTSPVKYRIQFDGYPSEADWCWVPGDSLKSSVGIPPQPAELKFGDTVYHATRGKGLVVFAGPGLCSRVVFEDSQRTTEYVAANAYARGELSLTPVKTTEHKLDVTVITDSHGAAAGVKLQALDMQGADAGHYAGVLTYTSVERT